jgi:hypothetical protein
MKKKYAVNLLPFGNFLNKKNRARRKEKFMDGNDFVEQSPTVKTDYRPQKYADLGFLTTNFSQNVIIPQKIE